MIECACPSETELHVDCHGLSIAVVADDTRLLRDVLRHLPVGWKPASAMSDARCYEWRCDVDGHRYVVRQGTTVLVATDDLPYALGAFEYDLDLYVAENARERVFLHAGVVGWNGRALVIPGQSHSGKSSLVAALIAAGAVYYSDEYALLDSEGFVHAYPRPLHLRRVLPGVAEADAAPGSGHPLPPLPVGRIVLTRFVEGGCWQPKALSAGRAVLDLMNHAMSIRRQPDAVLGVLRRCLASAQILAGPRGEAVETARSLLQYSGHK